MGGLGVSRLGADQDLGLDLVVASQALSDEGSATAAHISRAATAHLGERMRYNEQRYDAVATKLGLDFVNDLDMDRDDAVRLAARLLGHADLLRRESGGPMPTAERFDVDRAEERLQRRLGAGFGDEFAAGSRIETRVLFDDVRSFSAVD